MFSVQIILFLYPQSVGSTKMQFISIAFISVFLVCITANPVSDTSLLFEPQINLSPHRKNETSGNISIILTNENNTVTLAKMQQLSDELYNSVITGDYEAAVTKSLQLEQLGNGEVIMITVQKLLKEGENKLIEFAYKLWNIFGKNIVKDYFPVEFRLLFNEDNVSIIDNTYLFPLTASTIEENTGRLMYGRSPYESTSFILKSIWEDNRVYFKFVDTVNQQYLELTNRKYLEDTLVYSVQHYNNFSQQWYLHPSKCEDSVLFGIFNRKEDRLLQISDRLEGNMVRFVVGHKSESSKSSDCFGWHIKPFSIKRDIV